MAATKIEAGQQFPALFVPRLGGGKINLSKPENANDWHMVVVYRGKHCPLCTKYLADLNRLLPEFRKIGVEVVAVSADPDDRAQSQISEIKPDFPVGYDLTVNQMRELGLYISHPRSPSETDRSFSEPGLFVVNAEGNVQITDISNAPFARPDLATMLMGLRFIRNPEHNYPIRGTHH